MRIPCKVMCDWIRLDSKRTSIAFKWMECHRPPVLQVDFLSYFGYFLNCSQFITFMVKLYYIYGCSVYYIYGQILLHLWLVDLLHLWLKAITFMVNFYYFCGWYYIYGFYYIYGWYTGTHELRLDSSLKLIQRLTGRQKRIYSMSSVSVRQD